MSIHLFPAALLPLWLCYNLQEKPLDFLHLQIKDLYFPLTQESNYRLSPTGCWAEVGVSRETGE